MNPVRTLLALLVITLGAMGTWVWKVRKDESAARRLVQEVRESKARALLVKDQQTQQALQAQADGHQQEIQRLNNEHEKKLDEMRNDLLHDEHKRLSAAMEQFGGILEGNKKTLAYIDVLEQKVKSGQALSKNEAEKLAVIVTGLTYLQKQYEKPFQQFTELDAYLAKRAEATVEAPNTNFSFWKRMFSKDYREKEAEYHRSEGEKRGFQEAQERFGQAYAAAQKQMKGIALQGDKIVADLSDFAQEKRGNVQDLSEFFDQARKALVTHQKVLDFQPESPKPAVETARP